MELIFSAVCRNTHVIMKTDTFFQHLLKIVDYEFPVSWNAIFDTVMDITSFPTMQHRIDKTSLRQNSMQITHSCNTGENLSAYKND